MSELEELLERVRSATGPDRDLDAEICLALGGEHKATLWRNPGEGWWTGVPREVTASIDAALALTERVLPASTYKSFERVPAGWWQACVDDTLLIKHETAPLAILAATLSALIAQEPK